ncbi:unnamed protein product [Laminaria digitata]
MCHKHCSKKKSATHMALEWGIECFCGSKKDDYDQYGNTNACTKKCPGDSKNVCGGPLALSVYKL